MAKSKQPIHAEQKGLIIVSGSYAPDSANAPATLKGGSGSWTVAWTATGKHTITFAESYNELVEAHVTLMSNTYADTVATVGPFTAATATAPATLVIFIGTGGSAADITANANNRVHFSATFRSTDVTS